MADNYEREGDCDTAGELEFDVRSYTEFIFPFSISITNISSNAVYNLRIGDPIHSYDNLKMTKVL